MKTILIDSVLSKCCGNVKKCYVDTDANLHEEKRYENHDIT